MISLGPRRLEWKKVRKDGYPADPASHEVFNRAPKYYKWVLQSRLIATPLAVLAFPVAVLTIYHFSRTGMAAGPGLLMLAGILAVFLAPLCLRSFWIRSLRRRLEAQEFFCCPSCLYPLQALRDGAPCPECGFRPDALRVRRAWKDLFNTVLATKYEL